MALGRTGSAVAYQDTGPDGVRHCLKQTGAEGAVDAAQRSAQSDPLRDPGQPSIEFRRYQPGGLAERSRLLRQLVEPKAPQSLNETVELLRGWRRSLRRAQELEIATPDSTLLDLGALDRIQDLFDKGGLGS